MMDNLAGCLYLRFRRTDNLDYLNSAITKGEEAIAAAPHTYPDRARWLSNLCKYLGRRSQRTGSLADIIAAAAVGQEAVASTALDDPARSRSTK